MSRNELTDAFERGSISRRSFVRGMVALGASVGAAVALADNISAAPGAKRSALVSDTYDTGGAGGETGGAGYPESGNSDMGSGTTSGGEMVTALPSTGVAETSSSVGKNTVIAAGAAAAAAVALRMRQPKQSKEDAS